MHQQIFSSLMILWFSSLTSRWSGLSADHHKGDRSVVVWQIERSPQRLGSFTRTLEARVSPKEEKTYQYVEWRYLGFSDTAFKFVAVTQSMAPSIQGKNRGFSKSLDDVICFR